MRTNVFNSRRKYDIYGLVKFCKLKNIRVVFHETPCVIKRINIQNTKIYYHPVCRWPSNSQRMSLLLVSFHYHRMSLKHTNTTHS